MSNAAFIKKMFLYSSYLTKQTVFAMKSIIQSLQKYATRNLNAMNGLKFTAKPFSINKYLH